MSLTNAKHQLVEEIELFIRFAVPEDQIQQAIALVHRYRKNHLILRLFREYYSALPEAREERIVRVARLIDRQGVYLVVVSTPAYSYLYALSADQVLLLGEYQKEVDQQVLSFFGFESQESFLKKCPSASDLGEYAELNLDEHTFCPACGVPDGEFHLLGCSVEICPWCDAQLSNCNCRYEQLETDDIQDEKQLEKFVDLLTAKGRIPYNRDQAPLYPGTSGGLDEGENDS
ncbi:MAG: hypothetical protein WBB19_13015 [Desulforhopalus sp.]